MRLLPVTPPTPTPAPGWKPKEEQMSTIVAIHNSVNERCWQQVLAWEQPYIEK